MDKSLLTGVYLFSDLYRDIQRKIIHGLLGGIFYYHKGVINE